MSTYSTSTSTWRASVMFVDCQHDCQWEYCKVKRGALGAGGAGQTQPPFPGCTVLYSTMRAGQVTDERC